MCSPRKSIRHLPQLDLGESLKCRIFQKDVKVFPYKLQKQQFLVG